jgi:predicted GIY-YIG superfamily endonuclease
MSDVYLLHFDKPYWNNARHYVGYTTKTAEERIAKHRDGTGSLLVNYAIQHGNDFKVAMVEHYDTKYEAVTREFELKNSHALARTCPICQANKVKGA